MIMISYYKPLHEKLRGGKPHSCFYEEDSREKIGKKKCDYFQLPTSTMSITGGGGGVQLY